MYFVLTSLDTVNFLKYMKTSEKPFFISNYSMWKNNIFVDEFLYACVI